MESSAIGRLANRVGEVRTWTGKTLLPLKPKGGIGPLKGGDSKGKSGG